MGRSQGKTAGAGKRTHNHTAPREAAVCERTSLGRERNACTHVPRLRTILGAESCYIRCM